MTPGPRRRVEVDRWRGVRSVAAMIRKAWLLGEGTGLWSDWEAAVSWKVWTTVKGNGRMKDREAAAVTERLGPRGCREEPEGVGNGRVLQRAKLG